MGDEVDTLQIIECKALGKAITPYTPFRQNKTIQLKFDWQNNGDQKIYIQGEEGKCPACSKVEHHLHYAVKCNNSRIKIKRKELFNQISKALQKLDTYYDGIIASIQISIEKECKTASSAIQYPNAYTDELLLQALVSQQQIVTNAFCVFCSTFGSISQYYFYNVF